MDQFSSVSSEFIVIKNLPKVNIICSHAPKRVLEHVERKKMSIKDINCICIQSDFLFLFSGKKVLHQLQFVDLLV